MLSHTWTKPEVASERRMQVNASDTHVTKAVTEPTSPAAFLSTSFVVSAVAGVAGLLGVVLL